MSGRRKPESELGFERMRAAWVALILGLSVLPASVSATVRPAVRQAAPTTLKAQDEAEARVITYIRAHLEPGKPLLVTQLYNQVFTDPAERAALDKLYRAFFRIPLFVAHYQEKFGRPPTLRTIADQFDLHAPGAADVLLRVMQSDPRIPRFLARDPKTGEITRVDIAKVRLDPDFGQALEHQIAGWEGRHAPAFKLPGLEGGNLDSSGLAGKTVLLYVWFTGCPPCMQETPQLVDLNHAFDSGRLEIIGANADRELGLSYGDSVRHRYLIEHKVDFPVAHWTKEADAAYGGISIFPTLFLIDSRGLVRGHWVGFVKVQELRNAIGRVTRGG
jgi:thiol-disulfide isomerase/thioredoxin